tara:strand:+ start:15900 stop:18005 length:2106 start_codon:yes stop_codon:yes gene_type:complete
MFLGSKSTHNHIYISFFLYVVFMPNKVLCDKTKWLAIGSLHSWYSSAGSEIEIGRTHEITEQQDGLRWPALYRWQDCQVAKALWIGTTDYNDLIVNKTYDYKVVHIGPRGPIDENNEFMSEDFTLIGKFPHPTVIVDGQEASHTTSMDKVDVIDENLITDRMLYNVVNTSIGVTITRKIYASSNQYHDNYFIHEYIYKNTGIYNKNNDRHSQTLEGLIFFYQFRFAPSREIGLGGLQTLPQSTSWGHNTMNHIYHPFYDDTLRGFYSYHGLHSDATFDNIGGPNISGDGHLGASQFPGVVVLHADVSAENKNDDNNQPLSTPFLDSGSSITRSNNQFDQTSMLQEYQVMSSGHPALPHDEAVGDEYPDQWQPISQSGKSQCLGFGPYELAPNDSIRIVFAEGVNGINRNLCYQIGSEWLQNFSSYSLPNGETTNDKNEFKNSWVFTGIDSILKTFNYARINWELGFDLPRPPPPPDIFEVNSGGNGVDLSWSNNAESWPNFTGYKIYRSIHKPDTTFNLIFECGSGTDNEIVNNYFDNNAIRGFQYYYYISSIDDGSTNIFEEGVPLKSNLFWTRTNEPAYLLRPPGNILSDIRIVPNPYNRKAINLQFGESGPDKIMFYNLPPFCTIKIFSERGDLIITIEHNDGSGDEAWDSLTKTRQVVSSGLYIAHFEVTQDYFDSHSQDKIFKKGDRAIKKFVVIR